MPCIITAIVLRWKVVKKDRQDYSVQFVDSKSLSIFVGDSANVADTSPIIAQYILNESQGNPQLYPELLEAAANGLLQVVDTRKLPANPPPVPVNYSGSSAPPNGGGGTAGTTARVTEK